jgi:hypothetical protein
VKKLKWIPVIIALTLMLSGFAYAGWTEKIQLNFSTKTAFMEFVVLEVHENGLDVDDGIKGQLTIRAKEIMRGEEMSADIVYVNTGTIPVNIYRLALSSLGGYEPSNKHNLYIDIRAYANGNLIFDESEKVNYWNSNGSIHRKSNSTEIPVGGTVTVQVNVRFEGKNENNGKKKGNEEENNEVFDNVTFILRPEYSRFNEGS